MFYISSFNQDTNSYGITDTVDGVEEFYSVKDIKNIMENTTLSIVGVMIYELYGVVDVKINVVFFRRKYYKLKAVDNNTFHVQLVSEFYEGNHQLKTVPEETIQMNEKEYAKFLMLKGTVEGNEIYVNSKIKPNSEVLTMRYDNKFALVNSKVTYVNLYVSEKLLFGKTCRELIKYCQENNLKIKNDVGSDKRTNPVLSGVYNVGTYDMVRVKNYYFPVDILEKRIWLLAWSLFPLFDMKRQTIRGIYNHEHETCYFILVDLCKVITVKLGTTPIDIELPDLYLEKYDFEWKNDILKYGCCISDYIVRDFETLPVIEGIIFTNQCGVASSVLINNTKI